MAAPTSVAHIIMLLLARKKLDGIIIDHDDPHSTEFPHPAFGALEYVSNFSGSWGKAVITLDRGYLWTDSRYYIQAEKQLMSPWELMRYGEKGLPTVLELISSQGLKRVGIDPYTTAYSWLKQAKKSHKDIEFVELYENPIYELWKARPNLPLRDVVLHPEMFAGLAVDEKLYLIRKKMEEAKTDALVLSLLDEVAYALNLRGGDLEFSPMFYAFLVIEADTATLFIDPRKLGDDIMDYLDSYGIKTLDYGDLADYLKTISYNAPPKPDGGAYKLWVSPCASVAICNSFLSGQTEAIPRVLYEQDTPVCMMKAVKNEIELEGMKEAHILDGIALADFLATVENMRRSGSLFEASEIALGEHSTNCRAQVEGNIGLSFHPISSIGPNSAVVHYRATEETNAMITESVYLLDSGGQYLGGTTDVTRTLHFGMPTQEEKDAYTEVLKGHLALRHAVFAENTSGATLDVLARQFLWKSGRNYYHGTGHGVGAYLNVHEGPQAITSLRKPCMGKVNVVYLEPGMVLSNEPGYYKEGHFGIRIENVVYVKKMEDGFSKDHCTFYTFEDLTLVPYCKTLMNVKMLTTEEINWINEYHQLIADTLIPRMKAISPERYAHAIEYLQFMATPLIPWSGH